MSGGVQYELRLGAAMTLTPRLNYSYVSGQYTSLTYSQVTDYLPAHGLFSALLTLQLGGPLDRGGLRNQFDRPSLPFGPGWQQRQLLFLRRAAPIRRAGSL